MTELGEVAIGFNEQNNICESIEIWPSFES